MKNVILSASSGLKKDQLCVWVKSLKKTNFSGDIVVFINKNDIDSINFLKQNEIKTIIVENFDVTHGYITHSIQDTRFLHYYNFLRDKKYKNVLHTDISDVFFQKNPFDYIDNTLEKTNKKIILSLENQIYKDSEWNSNNLISTQGHFFHNLLKNEIIINSGIIAGNFEYLKDVFLQLYFRTIGYCYPNLQKKKYCQTSDQSVFNTLMRTFPYKDISFFGNLEFSVNFDLILKQDKKHLLHVESPIISDDGKFYTKDKKLISIVHQYNRSVELTNKIKTICG